MPGTSTRTTTSGGHGGRGDCGRGKGRNSKKKKQQPPRRQPSSKPTTTGQQSPKKPQQPPSAKAQRKPEHYAKRTPKAATDPPLECSRSDFEALLCDASGLAGDEVGRSFLDCARFGEVDACRAILDVWLNREGPSSDDDESGAVGEEEGGAADAVCAEEREARQCIQPIVDSRDASGSTALHKACANGHASTVRLLLNRGAIHMANDSGNTPLHWAAGAGHVDCVAALLDHYDALHSENAAVKRLDVLAKNGFGRSALTEGFASGNTKAVEHLLNHDSAEEERLIGGLKKEDFGGDDVEVDGSGDAEGKESNNDKKGEKDGIIHEFDFLRRPEGNDEDEGRTRPSVLIRELPIAHADDPFGKAPIEDTTGLGVWCASLVMSRWLASPNMVERMRGKSVLELGAGCGIPALTAALHGTPGSVMITDLNPETVHNILHNIKLNRNDDDCGAMANVTAGSIEWGDEATYPPEKLDYIVCSDCIYQKEVVPLLKGVVTGLIDPNGGTFLYVAPDGGRDGLPEFVAAMKSNGFECAMEEIAPDSYRENPLRGGDEEDFFLHFNELASTAYVLYEFRRC